LVALDGFSFSQPRLFDPRFYTYDIVRRPSTGEELGTPLEGVFHLYKLHGSVNWERRESGEVQETTRPDAETACLIYPARGKYQQSYMQPHLDVFAQYFAALREPNLCLIAVGFGFNDDHLSEPLLAAVRSNPHLRVIVANRSARKLVNDPRSASKYWKELSNLSKQGEDVWYLNASFREFSELVPDLKAFTPAQQLATAIRRVAGS